MSEPEDVSTGRGGIDKKYQDRTPRVIVDDEGRHFIWAEGLPRPFLVKGRPKGSEIEAQWERDDAKHSFIMWSDRMGASTISRSA